MHSSALVQSHLGLRAHSLCSACLQSKKRQIDTGAVLLLLVIHRPAR